MSLFSLSVIELSKKLRKGVSLLINPKWTSTTSEKSLQIFWP